MSLRHAGQLSGSFIDTSGCGSKMIFPSFVLCRSSTERSDSARSSGGLVSGGNGEGNEEADLRAGAFRRPRGSLRLLCDIKRTEPREIMCERSFPHSTRA